MEPVKNIVVLGGGTAGWITALMVQKRIPKANITLIESSEIGIIGAGEGSTPAFINFLNYVDISIEDLIKNAGTTFKNGLKFSNWNGDNSYYFHDFSPINVLNSDKMFHNKDNFGKHTLFYWLNIYHDQPLSRFDFMSTVSDLERAPFQKLNAATSTTDSLSDYRNVGAFGLHFDARLLADYFKKIGIERGINKIEAEVINVVSNKSGDITSLTLKDQTSIPLDFVFDCSGFHRVLIGKHFEVEWESSSSFLSCNSAVPFFIEMDNVIPPYTECIAMKYGWMWKIPLQDRYGCGYVFDSKFISEKEAVLELEEYLGYEPTYPRKTKGAFKFDPGFYKKTWVNNCVAIGLSSGFMEPLEATNIGVALINLTDVLTDVSALSRRSEEDLNYYNNQVYKLNSEIAEFLYMHYMTKRSDTNFWLQFNDVEAAPTNIKPLMKSLATSIPSVVSLGGWDAFNYGSFYQIALGINYINTNLVKEAVSCSSLSQRVYSDYFSFRKYLEDEAVACLDHRTLLKSLGGFNNEN